MVRHFGKIQCPLASYGLTRLRGCSTVDWQGSEMLSGFKINCSPSQIKYVYTLLTCLCQLYVEFVLCISHIASLVG